jgi:hypothetical protein
MNIKKKSKTSPKSYLVINNNNEAFMGLIAGSAVWTSDWDQGKPLFEENTTKLVKEHKVQLLEI